MSGFKDYLKKHAALNKLISDFKMVEYPDQGKEMWTWKVRRDKKFDPKLIAAVSKIFGEPVIDHDDLYEYTWSEPRILIAYYMTANEMRFRIHHDFEI